MADQQIVSASEILSSAGADKPVKQGTFLQRTGLLLAGGIGTLAAVIVIILVAKVVSSIPPPPVISMGADPNAVKALLENYKALEQVAIEPYINLFDTVIVKVLLPIFTTVLGYIFGSRQSKDD